MLYTLQTTTQTLINRLSVAIALLHMLDTLEYNINTTDQQFIRNIRDYAEKIHNQLLPFLPTTNNNTNTNDSTSNDLRSRLQKALGGSTSTTNTSSSSTSTSIDPSLIIPSAPNLPHVPTNTSWSSNISPSSSSTHTTNDNIIDLPTIPNTSSNISSTAISPSSSLSLSATSSYTSTDYMNSNDVSTLRTQLHQAYNEINDLRQQITNIITQQVQTQSALPISNQITTLQNQILAATHAEQLARNENLYIRQEVNTLNNQIQKLNEEIHSLQSNNHNLQQLMNASTNLREDLLHVQQELENRDKLLATLRSKMDINNTSSSSTTTTSTNRRNTIHSATSNSLVTNEDEGSTTSTNIGSTSSTGAGLITTKFDPNNLLRLIKGDVTSIRHMKEEELLHIQETLQDIQKTISRRLLEYHEENMDQALCIICIANKKNTVLVPCGHLCVCHECTTGILKANPPKCPVCRTIVEDSKVVYT